MKKQNVFFLIAIIVLSSCSHTYYVPNTVNVPLFKEKNEVRLAGYYASDEVTTYEIQGAYSITNSLAIMVNGMYAYEYTSEDYGFGHYLDAAVGYYKPLNKHFVVEVFGGLGACKQYHYYESDNSSGMYTANMWFMKNFIQPSIGFTSDYFDIALSTRLATLTFFDFKFNLPSDNTGFDDLQKIITRNNYLLFEPALTIRGGWKYVKLQAQICPSFQVFPHRLISSLPSQGGIISAGLCFSFAKRYYRKKQDKKPPLLP